MNKLPRPIEEAIRFLRAGTNLNTVGLFRKVPRVTLLDLLHDTYSAGLLVNLEDWPEPAILAGSSIKLYLRQLRCPIFPRSVYAIIKACTKDLEESLAFIRGTIMPAVIEEHPDGELAVVFFRHVMALARDVSRRRGRQQQ